MKMHKSKKMSQEELKEYKDKKNEIKKNIKYVLSYERYFELNKLVDS